MKNAFEKFNQFIIKNKEAIAFLTGCTGGSYLAIKEYKYYKLEQDKYLLERDKFLLEQKKYYSELKEQEHFQKIEEALGVIDNKLTINNNLYLSLHSDVEMLGISPETSPNSSPNQDGEY